MVHTKKTLKKMSSHCDVRNLIYHFSQGYLYRKDNGKSMARFSRNHSVHMVAFRFR